MQLPPGGRGPATVTGDGPSARSCAVGGGGGSQEAAAGRCVRVGAMERIGRRRRELHPTVGPLASLEVVWCCAMVPRRRHSPLDRSGMYVCTRDRQLPD